jgi:polysaccharide deacetylase 2 family uncharacterized protein YibQ
MRLPQTSRAGGPPPPAAGNGLSALAVTSIALVVFVCAVGAWLQFSGPPTTPKAGPAVVVQLSPPPKPEPAPAPPPVEPPAAQPAAPDSPAEVPDVPAKTPSPGDTAANPAPQSPESSSPEQPSAAPDSPGEPAPDSAETPALQTAPPPIPTAPPTQTAKIPAAVTGGLRPAPDPALVEKTRLGPLPRVSPDGRKPWQTYARPFDPGDRRPRVAIIVSGLGLSGAATEAAIQRLPGPVTLAFAPYSKGLPQWIALARAAGHEVLLDLPMEPVNFPANDPGPHTLLTSLTADQNRERLHWLLGRVTGYVGVVNRMGSRFTTSATHVRPVLKELEKRGLLFVDSRSSLRSVAAQMAREVGLPRAINNRFIDGEASRDAIDSRLHEIERIAKASGYAVGIGAPFPVTIDRLVRWAKTLESKKLVLAPISALVNTQTN